MIIDIPEKYHAFYINYSDIRSNKTSNQNDYQHYQIYLTSDSYDLKPM